MLNVSGHKCSQVIYDTESAQISQKQDGGNYYILYTHTYTHKHTHTHTHTHTHIYTLKTKVKIQNFTSQWIDESLNFAFWWELGETMTAKDYCN